MRDFKRMWINQPSTHDPLHDMHGINVLAVVKFRRRSDPPPAMVQVYHLSGPVISQQVPRLALSEGWRGQHWR